MKNFVLCLLFGTILSAPIRAQNIPDATVVPTPTIYRELAAQVETNLKTQVLNQWFPRAINNTIGGYDQNFSENWTNTSDGERSIVYQARLTWLSAQAALRFPAEASRWKAASAHGANYLKTAMWDAQNGGFFWELKNGAPQRDGEKHAYGTAFAIYALSANYRASGDPTSLQLAQDAFRWLDAHAHDAKNGGYFEALTRQGTPILAPLPDRDRDPISTRYGFKSMNTHIHLLEALAALHEIWPDPTLTARLREVFGLVRDTIVVMPTGAMNQFFTLDWKAVPHSDSFGHDIETAYLLVEAAQSLEMPDDASTWAAARALVDHTLAQGLDAENGGFYDEGGAFRGVYSDGKIWWVQAESLNALLLMHQKYGAQTPRYFNEFVRQWNWIRVRQTDHLYGGWLANLSREGAAQPGADKSNKWTEAYHQGRALLNVSKTLSQMAVSKP